MKAVWFKKFGWIYLPVSIIGWVIWLFGLALSVNIFLAIDRHSHSVSDTLYGIFPYFTCILLLINWVAENTSVKK